MIGLREYINHEPKPLVPGDLLVLNMTTGTVTFQRNGHNLGVASRQGTSFKFTPAKENDFARFIADLAELDIRPLHGEQDNVRYEFVALS